MSTMRDMDKAVKTQRDRFIEGAVRYARSQASDPFAFARCMTHINMGIVSTLENGEDAMYDADEITVMNANGGSTKSYLNVKRP